MNGPVARAQVSNRAFGAFRARPAELSPVPDERQMRRDGLARGEDVGKDVECFVRARVFRNPSQTARHAMDVRVNRADIAAEIESGDARGRLQPDSVEGTELAQDIAGWRLTQVIEGNFAARLSDLPQDFADAWRLHPRQTAASDGGRDGARTGVGNVVPCRKSFQ
jgi:hypothetical protein